jgi:hypothetical protein
MHVARSVACGSSTFPASLPRWWPVDLEGGQEVFVTGIFEDNED